MTFALNIDSESELSISVLWFVEISRPEIAKRLVIVAFGN